MKTLRFEKNSLIVLCGPAGSGKSYFARKFFRPSQIVSSDHCRKMISDSPANQRVSPEAFELMDKIVEFRLKYNRLTVADATHLVAEYRRTMIDLARKYDRPVYIVVFDTDRELCEKNNAARARKVEAEVLAAHQDKFCLAKEQIQSEPYQAVYILTPAELSELKIDLF